MQNELDIIRDVAARLAEAGIPYMLTGSVAMNYYANPRMTRDIDVVVSLQQKDIDTIMASFEDDYYLDRNAVTRAIGNQSLFNLIHNQSIIKVDCIVKKSTEYRSLEFDRRKEVKIKDTKVWIVSKEDLIISKLYWARDSHSEFQLRDVRNLLSSGYDAEYLEHWTTRLSLSDLLKECLDE
jgi:predicted nucleotidyltransferase